jgi:hypothetical protein
VGLITWEVPSHKNPSTVLGANLEYTKVRDIGFVTGKEFVGGLLEETMQVEPVYGVAGCVHSFRPKPLRCLELSKHHSRHVD